MPATVEGGTPAQRELMREILDGLGDTSIELIRLDDWVDDFEEHPSLGLVPTQEEIDATRGTSVRLAAPDPADYRAHWETRLVADAFQHLSTENGLPRVVWVQVGSAHGSVLRSGTRAPLDQQSLEQLRRDLEEAAAVPGTEVEYLDILRPHGHAWAIRLRVDEPHSFCRHGFRNFSDAVESWFNRCAGRYLEVRDYSENDLVLVAADGMSTLRPDLACCDPLFIYGRSLMSPPRPPCPVFDR